MHLTEATLDEILKGTSRAFYLSLAVLPAGARTPLSLAYLIARAADTIADAPAGSQPADRPALLLQLKAAVLSATPWDASSQSELSSLQPEKIEESRLLSFLPSLLGHLQQRPSAEKEAIRQVVGTLIDGMIWDQRLFGEQSDEARAPASDSVQRGLDDEELEKYTYLVAGCVGPFWSKVCAISDPRLAPLADPGLDGLAAEFGKGLQWVNILRDIPKDQESGRFYLPALAAPGFRQRFLAQTSRGLRALTTACRYPKLFPGHFLRHRMAVFWLLVLGLRTLEKLLTSGGPRPGQRVKVPRWEVLLWVALSPLLVISDTVLTLVLEKLCRRAERALISLEDPHATNF